MNRDLARERTALFLYVVLVVLPAVVFGALLAHRLHRDHQVELAAVPDRCADAARRLAESVAYVLETRLDKEGERPFFHYQDEFLDPATTSGVAMTPTPLSSERRPEGVLAWYVYDDYDPRRADAAQFFFGQDPALDVTELRRIVKQDLTDEEFAERARLEQQVADIEAEYETQQFSYRVLAVNLHRGDRAECYSIPDQAREEMTRMGTVRITPMRLRMLRDRAGELRLVAERLVYVPGEQLELSAPDCIRHLENNHRVYQGVVLDPAWLFEELPNQVAKQVLDPTQSLVHPSALDAAASEAISVCGENLFNWVPVLYAPRNDAELGQLFVATDRTELASRFRVQMGWLAGVAAVLALSMFVGLRLLVGRIKAASDEAQRTRNFVAAVTHELRTPVAAVKLYGEMLADGWIHDEARRQDYIDRIVRETDRLSALIDRVLLRRKLQDQPPAARPGDLNKEVLAQRRELELVGGRPARDLAFDLAADLPPVLLVPDGVHVVVTNLVENARKYAPVDLEHPDAEPIVLRTRRDQRSVVLEVLDRGPGVPERERRKIFDAFYRPGDERTRATTGTGLGLHLVALQARAMRGKVEVLPREGGGSNFRFTFRVA